MPKPRKNETVRCTHFKWRLVNRHGKWYADGRSNVPNAGRHSLDTDNIDEARSFLPELDRVRAEDLGLISRSTPPSGRVRRLPLDAGRKLYEAHIARPRVTGGVRKSTQKRYRTVFDKFISFAESRGITVWNGATANVLNAYADHLEQVDYAHKTLVNELTTLKQAVKWLVQEGHLGGMQPIELKLRKAESQPAYCYRPKEVEAMVTLCQQNESLFWMGDLIVAFACTGLRIAEMASLRWPDIDLESKRLTLTDETGRSTKTKCKRRELKSGRSRSFPVHHDLLSVLQKRPRQGAHVFYGPRGGRLKPDTARRTLIREVIEPLSDQFPSPEEEQGFKDVRFHSFRHYFCSMCANNGVPERMVMDWLGHSNSEMIRHYYHLHNEEAQRRMGSLNFLGAAGGRSAGEREEQRNKEDAETRTTERDDDGEAAD